MGLPCGLIGAFQNQSNERVWALPPGTLTPVPGLPDWLCSCESLVRGCRTSLNLSWNNACACEQLGNHFTFVGTDL